ncbi:MAG: dehydrogenase, partial [Nitrososphaerales archaeon]
FTWIIPTSERTAKVGAAGKGINSFRTLDRFVHEKGGSILKRVAAPIIVGGPIKNFINGRIIKAGDAARQTKPSTAGGIYSGGIGGILAGDSIAKAVRTGNPRTLAEYEKKWRRIFGREFSSTLRARAVFETLRNKHLSRILDELASSQNTLNLLSSHGDFDFHSAALLKAIGTGTVIKILKTVAAAELSRLRPFARSQS